MTPHAPLIILGAGHLIFIAFLIFATFVVGIYCGETEEDPQFVWYDADADEIFILYAPVNIEGSKYAYLGCL